MMSELLGTMITFTTYGTWLRGDSRGWVDDGTIQPPCPSLKSADIARQKHPAFQFREDQLFDVGNTIGKSLVERKNQNILALTVQTWHVHFVVEASACPIPDIVKCAKDAARWLLRLDRPIWTDGYDKRYCFTENDLNHRIGYINKHNDVFGSSQNPWQWQNVNPKISPP